MKAITAPGLRYVFEARVDIAPTKRIGQAGSAPLSFVPITGGTVTGPRLNGSVEPGGGDWAIDRSGYAVDLDARYLIRADDGALIDIVNKGFWVATPEIDAALDAGESVDPSAYYFRTQPVFRTDAPQYTWLTHTVFVGVAFDDNTSNQIRIQFFEVL
jgi:hypothetical protein